ncbi:unnamed protein product [Mytilus edulis]|uniref:Uncharacterized protein n=1 Tax=Mytilus edulis TaxID=6550 RepID=A0A8S3TV00_MYTED|nr:unnamed protein product [Mytilus edulis]
MEMNDFEEFERKLRCHYLFHDSKNDSKHPFYINSGYKPAYSCGTLENYLFATKYELSKINLKKMSPNLNKNEQKALRNLVKNKEIIVRKADKNSTLCILDKSTYIKEGLRQLENELYYEEINQSRIANATKLIHDLIEKWQRNDQIDKITYKFLLQNLFNKKIGKFFLLPKIHKIPPEILLEIENNPAKIIEYGFLGRPIVSLCGICLTPEQQIPDTLRVSPGWRHFSYSKKPIQTGWHNRINTAAKHAGVPFYVLIPDLMTEAEVVDYSVRADDLERDIQRKYTILEEKIQTAWDQYMGNVITTTHFLKVIAKLYKPSDKPLDNVQPI